MKGKPASRQEVFQTYSMEIGKKSEETYSKEVANLKQNLTSQAEETHHYRYNQASKEQESTWKSESELQSSLHEHLRQRHHTSSPSSKK